MQSFSPRHGLLISLKQVASHGAVTLIAVAFAFSLPPFARYILYDWWPRVEAHPNLLLATEITVASVLVLVANLFRIAWHYRHKAAASRHAALVHACQPGCGFLARWRERALIRRLPAARDAFIVSPTGYEVLVERRSPLREAIEAAREIRVLVLDPAGRGLTKFAHLDPSRTAPRSLCREIEATIQHLSELRRQGKSVALKFCEREPFWKVTVLGDHAWVQHCRTGVGATKSAAYVFAQEHCDPGQGLYLPFYSYVLKEWAEPSHADYDFESGEIVYREASGSEIGRARLEASGSVSADP